MKKLTLTFFLLIAFTGVSFAQFQASGTAAVEVDLVQSLKVGDNITDVDFGVAVNERATLTLDGNDGVTSSTGNDPIGTKSTGSMKLEGSSNYGVEVSGSTEVRLSNGTDELTFTPQFYIGGVATGTPNTGSLTLDDDGEAEVKIGGTLDIPNNTSDGQYTGTYEVTFTYTSI